jgi:hypothetical protein
VKLQIINRMFQNCTYKNIRYSEVHHTVAHSLKEKIVEPQQPAVIRQRPANNKREMVFSAQSVIVAANATMEHVMPSLSNTYTATKQRCSLCGPCRGYIMSAGVQFWWNLLLKADSWGWGPFTFLIEFGPLRLILHWMDGISPSSIK